MDRNGRTRIPRSVLMKRLLCIPQMFRAFAGLRCCDSISNANMKSAFINKN